MNNIMPKCWKESSKPHLYCPGCGHGTALKDLGLAIDELGIQRQTTLGIDIGCSLLAWDFFDIDTIQTHHGRTVPVMVGYKMAKPKRIAIAYMGEGGAYAIGLQSLLHAAYRSDPITVIVINNENYAMTGGQMSPTSEVGLITTTSPKGKSAAFGPGMQGPELVRKVASKSAFISRVSISNPIAIKNAIIKAIENQTKNKAFAFIEILSTCPTNWGTNAHETFERLKMMEDYYQTGELPAKVAAKEEAKNE